MSHIPSSVADMRTCKKCGITDPERGFYGPYDKACRGCRDKARIEQQRERYKTDPEFRKQMFTRWGQKHKLTSARRAEMLDRQGGRCAICGRPPAEGKRLVVDHDHRCCPGRGGCPKCIRGLLCDACNSGIGFLRDDTTLLKNAISYLRRAPIPTD